MTRDADNFTNEARELKERLEQKQRQTLWQAIGLKKNENENKALKEKQKRQQDVKHERRIEMREMKERMMMMMRGKMSKNKIKKEEEAIKEAEQIPKLREKAKEELMKIQR